MPSKPVQRKIRQRARGQLLRVFSEHMVHGIPVVRLVGWMRGGPQIIDQKGYYLDTSLVVVEPRLELGQNKPCDDER